MRVMWTVDIMMCKRSGRRQRACPLDTNVVHTFINQMLNKTRACHLIKSSNNRHFRRDTSLTTFENNDDNCHEVYDTNID